MTNNIPCERCGATDWAINVMTGCDKCEPSLSMDRMEKQMNCEHKNIKPSRIVGLSKCIDCELVGVEWFKKGGPIGE